jgi:hypothetical protein
MTGTLHEGPYKFVIITPSMVVKMRTISARSFAKIKAQILCSVIFFFFVNHTVYEIMRDNTIQPD